MIFNFFKPEPHSQKTIKALWKLEKLILDTLDFNEVVQKIVDSVLTELGYLQLGYRIIVLILYDEEKRLLKRISLSQTQEAHKLLTQAKIPFPEMDIPLTAGENLCVKTFETQIPHNTTHWPEILCPPYTEEEALSYQNLAGIKASKIYPVLSKGKTLGVLIFSLIKPLDQVTEDEEDLIRSFTDVVGLAVQNAKLYTSLESTTQKLTEVNEKLKNANEKLHELDKLKDEFVSLASHELRSPMTAIKGSLSTILEGYAGEVSPQTREFLTAASNENDRLLRLVNNLLNISRIESGRFIFTVTSVDMEKLLQEVITSFQPAATERGIYLVYEKGENVLPLVFADEDKVREVLINLIGNAVKFTHKGGITLRTRLNASQLVTSVTDTGSGIAAEDTDRLFKKFSQVGGNYARPTGGTGLGLYICKQIVEGLNGKIWLDSEVGKGSTFYFSLPIVE